jgi:uncharacterized protein (TIGR02145 family)
VIGQDTLRNNSQAVTISGFTFTGIWPYLAGHGFVAQVVQASDQAVYFVKITLSGNAWVPSIPAAVSGADAVYMTCIGLNPVSAASTCGTPAICVDPNAVAPFACGETVSYGGQDYATVAMLASDGSSAGCWFAENLNIGTAVNLATTQSTSTSQKYCPGATSSDPAATNCASGIGGAYAIDSLLQTDLSAFNASPGTVAWPGSGLQGLCPPGWHVPTEAEFTPLLWGYSALRAYALLAAGTWGFGTGTSGFNAKPFVVPASSTNGSVVFWTSSFTAGRYRVVYLSPGGGAAAEASVVGAFYEARCMKN